MRNYSKTLALILTLAMLLSCTSVFAGGFTAETIEVRTNETSATYVKYVDDFKGYSVSNSTAFGAEKAIEGYKNKAQEIAKATDYKWVLSGKVMGRSNQYPGWAYMENGSLRVADKHQYGTAVNLVPNTALAVGDASHIVFTSSANSTDNRHGLRAFVDSTAENTFYEFACYRYSDTDNRNLPYFRISVNGSEKYIVKGTDAITDKETVTWDIRVDNGIVSWTMTATNGKTWSGSYLDPNFDTIMSKAAYPVASYTRGDTNTATGQTPPKTTYVEFESGKAYINMGIPATYMHYDLLEGKAITDGVAQFRDKGVVRVITAPELANEKTTISLSADNSAWDTLEVKFDENGTWINNQNENEYGYIDFGSNILGANVYTDLNSTKTITVPVKESITLDAKIQGSADDIVWSSSEEGYATVQNGKVTAKKSGTTVVSAEKSGISLSVNVVALGEFQAAINNDAVEAYIEEKTPVIDAINGADAEGIVDIINSDDGLALITDINIEQLRAMDDDAKLELAQRLDTYKFRLGSEQDVLDFIATIDNEYLLAQANHVTDTAVLQQVIEDNAKAFSIDVSSQEYVDNKAVVLVMLADKEFKNLADFQMQFNNATENYIAKINDLAKKMNTATVDEMKTIITTDLADIAKTPFKGLKAIEIDDIVALDSDKLETLAKRMGTYTYAVASLEDINGIIETLETEYYVGKLCNISDKYALELALAGANTVLGLDLEGDYLAAKDVYLSNLVNTEFENKADLVTKFENAIGDYSTALSELISKMNNADSAAMLALIDNKEIDALVSLKFDTMGEYDFDAVRAMADENRLALAERLCTYTYSCDSLADVAAAINAITTEFYVDKFQNIASETDMLALLKDYGEKVHLPVKTDLYAKAKDDIAAALVNKTFTNAAQMHDIFSVPYVMTNYNAATTAEEIQNIVENAPAELGYNVEHFESIQAKDLLYRQIISTKSQITTFDALLNKIDSFPALEYKSFTYEDDFSTYNATNSKFGEANKVTFAKDVNYVIASDSDKGSRWISSGKWVGSGTLGRGYMRSDGIVVHDIWQYQSSINLDLGADFKPGEYQEFEVHLKALGDARVAFRAMINSGDSMMYEFNRYRGSDAVNIRLTPVAGRLEGSKDGYVSSTKRSNTSLTFDGEMVWKVTINNGVVTFNVSDPANPSKTWSGMFIDENYNDLVKDFRYPFAIASTGDGAIICSYVKYTTGTPYVTMGEPDNALYADFAEGEEIDEDGTIELKDSTVVRKIIAPALANTKITLGLSADGRTWTNYENAAFDENGQWLNNLDAVEYKYVKLPVAQDAAVKVLCDMSDSDTFTVMGGKPATFMAKSDDAVTWKAYATTVNQETGEAEEKEDYSFVSVENGVVTVLKDAKDRRTGKVIPVKLVAITENGVEMSTNLDVVGEIRRAQLEGKVDEYLASKAPIVSALSSGNAQTIEDMIKGKATYNLSDIVDLDLAGAKALDILETNQFAAALETYSFKCESIDDIYAIQDAIDKEVNTVKLNGKETAKEVEELLNQQRYDENGKLYYVYGLDLDNEYYLDAKDVVLDAMTNKVFKNFADVEYTFENAYVIDALKNTDTYSYVGKLITDCDDEIGYDEKRLEEENINLTNLYKEIFGNIEDIDTIEELRDFIDNYEDDEDSDSFGGGGSGGGGGFGGGGSSVNVSSNLAAGSLISGATTQLGQSTVMAKTQIYSDVPVEHWAYDATRYLTAKGAINGYGDGTFLPGQAVTRAEFIKILLTGFGVEVPELAMTTDEEGNEVAPEMAFGDISINDWYAKYMAAAKDMNVLFGDENGNCNPNARITREEMSAFVCRMIEANGKTLPKSETPFIFEDGEYISDWAFGSVSKLQLAGIINGYGDGCFAPKASASRAESAKVIYIAFNYMQDIPEPVEETAEEETTEEAPAEEVAETDATTDLTETSEENSEAAEDAASEDAENAEETAETEATEEDTTTEENGEDANE